MFDTNHISKKACIDIYCSWDFRFIRERPGTVDGRFATPALSEVITSNAAG
jgi:hypothetical protein